MAAHIARYFLRIYLKQARQQRDELRAQLAAGNDPRCYRQQAKAAVLNTFAALFPSLWSRGVVTAIYWTFSVETLSRSLPGTWRSTIPLCYFGWTQDSLDYWEC
ncbi:hypothetical protein [Lonsdalea quercina]|uniref:hypothetical protein n=1 Tax=Lonsdalea quercina TaxID=71657 RepID=UPI0039747F2A